jgi:hypothetical protein
MKRLYSLLIIVLLSSCAHLPGLNREAGERADLWAEAHQALAAEEFERAETTFEQLAREYPESKEGRESLFYLGALRLDPRNPAWDPKPAELALRRYLAKDSVRTGSINRRPEGEVFLLIAQQLNLPAEERVPGLQPETRVVTERVVVPARESRALRAEVERLRQQLAERDAELARQKEELERIRKALTGGGS